MYIDRDGSSISTGIIAGLISAIISEEKLNLDSSQWESLFRKFEYQNLKIEDLIKEAHTINEKK